MLNTLKAIALRVALCLVAFAPAAHAGWSTLEVAGETVNIYRDEFGRPYIFATTNRGLFTAYGYAVAEDRLWQLELNRRAARGRLAEILGPGAPVMSDKFIRITGYTDAELDAWARRVAEWRRTGRDVYVYFDNDAKVHAPFDAMALRAM
jgi:acyl-homoserine lactone acylase PvdQ